MDKPKKLADIGLQVIKDDKSYVLMDKSYRPKEILGQGVFGCVVLMQNKRNIEDQLAAKIVVANKTDEVKQVNKEIETGKLVTGLPGMLNIMEGEDHAVGEISVKLVFMELLGPNLGDLVSFCNGSFSLKTTLMLGIQMVRRLELLHSVSLIHRDLKPENFVMGTGKGCQTVYLIDYGLATAYCGKGGANHVMARNTSDNCGTPRYMSKTAYNKVQSRRDDMEALSYVLAFFLLGKLPWMGMNPKTAGTKVMSLKRDTSSKNLLGHELSQHTNLVTFLDLCRNIDFAEKPAYDEMRHLLALCMKDAGMVYDYKFDWLEKK